MALQIRGTTQIRDASVSLTKIADVNSKTLLGRHDAIDTSGEMSALTASQARDVLDLATSDQVVFGTTSATSVTASSALISQGNLTVSGDTTLTGKLTANGSGNTMSDLTVSGAFVSNSSAELKSGATVTGETDTDTLVVNSSSTFTGHVDADSTIEVDGLSTMNGGISVSNASITHSGTGTLTSANVDINGGSIDNTIIGATTPAAGTFTSVTASSLVVSGNLTVSGTTTSISSTNLEVTDPIIQVAKDVTDNSTDFGFIGSYNDGSDKYAGLVRDASDSGKFKLFSVDQSAISNNSVDFTDNSYSKSVLEATINGNIVYDSAATFSLAGDLSGSQTFDGSGNVVINATIQDGSVDYLDIDFLDNDVDMTADSAGLVPTQYAVKNHVIKALETSGQSNLETLDTLMVDSTNKYVKVKEVSEFRTVIAGDLTNGVTTSVVFGADSNSSTYQNYVNTTFEELSNVYLNGQKLRYGADQNASDADYYFGVDGSGNRARLHLIGNSMELSDQLEIRYIIAS